MDINLSKTMNVGAEFRDRRGGLTWDCLLFAEVVFIDKTHPGGRPLVYQLRDSALSDTPPPLTKSPAFSLPSENFVLLGEVNFIDKKKKQIHLSNKNTVSYHYLVIASGSKPVYTEFAAGLQALVDALRVKPKIPSSFASHPSPFNPIQSKPPQHSTHEEKNPEFEKIIQPHIASATAKSISVDLNTINKRLYEVQT